MRRAALGLAVLVATAGVATAADDGVVCATALRAPVADLDAVLKSCSRIQGGQPSAVDRARVLRYRGIALQRTGNLPAAIADFDQVLQLTPQDTWALQGRAEAHETLGSRASAIADYGTLARLRPRDTRWRIKVSELGGTLPPPRPQTAEAGPEQPTVQTAPQAPPVQVAATAPPRALIAQPTPPAAAAIAPDQPALTTTPPAAPKPEQDPAALIRQVQASLRTLGYDVGAVNGRIGTKTRAAIDQFAADVGLEPGREPDQELLAAAEDTLLHRREQAAEEERDRNRRVQQALGDLGYYEGDIDGAFGPKSRRAFEQWLADTDQEAGQPVTETVAQALNAAVVARLSEPQAVGTASAPPADGQTSTVAEAPRQEDPPTSTLDVAALSSPEPSTMQRQPPQPPPATVIAPNQPGSGTVGTPASTPAASAPAQPYDILRPSAEAPDKRVALVIGNARYESVTPLVNPTNDAADVAAALAELGFEVLKGVDLSRQGMSRITRDFARRARTADIAMAYYSGHGMQFERTNYLVPVDGQIQDEYDLREMVELDQVIRDTSQAKKVGMVVVDACRNDPLATRSLARSLGALRSGSLGQGLAAPALPPSQSLIAYATAADFVAYDGDAGGRNSPFTAALLKNIKTPKLDVRQLFGKVSDEVRKATANAQRPDIWAALGGDPIYLVPGPPDPVGLEMTDLTGGEVLLVQRSLKVLKLWDGAEDGVATPALTVAVREWQRSQFADQTGRMIPQQVIALNRIAARDRPRQPLPELKLDEIFGRAFGGEVEAQRVMGMVYDPAFAEAPGFKKDRATARTFYEKAANQGDVAAAGLLGTMLVAPGNPTPDREEGPKWLELAAKGGDAGAALRLAEYVVERQPDTAGRAKAVPFLKIAATDPGTNGMANAWLRHVGQPPVVR